MPVEIQKKYVFMLTWLLLFLASVYLVPGLSTLFLVIESFLNAVLVFIVTYSIRSLFGGRTPSKLFAIILIALLVGIVYQNRGILSIASSKDVLSTETAFISGLARYIVGVTVEPPQASSEVPIHFAIPAGLARSAPPLSPFRPADPTIRNVLANVTFPADYDVLAKSVLKSINADRENSNLPPVSLNDTRIGQQHANSMLYFAYYSHWDTQGYKPYMRYTLLGGTGSVSENIALSYCTNWPARSTQVFPSSCTEATLENALNNSEWQMVHNDLACCNNGHRDNILNPLHDVVSLGISYNTETRQVYLVEDFEDSYVRVKQALNGGGNITLSGTMTRPVEFYSIAVVYDSSPITKSPSELNKMPHGYDAGIPIGGVFAPCAPGYSCPPTTVDGGIAVYSTTWQQSAGEFTIRFDLSSFVQKWGAGVYTFYLFDTSKNVLTTLSVFTQ